MAATFTHLLLWNREDISAAWEWMTPGNVKKVWKEGVEWRFWKDDGMRDREREEGKVGGKEMDPHYREMLKYPDAPNSWYFVTLAVSCVIALVVIYKTNSTLPW
jgi:hypothetical protein